MFLKNYKVGTPLRRERFSFLYANLHYTTKTVACTQLAHDNRYKASCVTNFFKSKYLLSYTYIF
jgi:hypothetical protein